MVSTAGGLPRLYGRQSWQAEQGDPAVRDSRRESEARDLIRAGDRGERLIYRASGGWHRAWSGGKSGGGSWNAPRRPKVLLYGVR